MSSQLVSLVWNGHHKTLVSVFEKLLVNSHFVDCTIAAEGQKMKVHKEVLSAFSPFFELLFREETENNPTVIVSGISFRDLRSLIDFMYQGKLEVTEERIQDLIDAAECLQIEGLGDSHKEDDSGNISNNTVLPKRPTLLSGIPHKRTRKGENEEVASVVSKESEVKNLNYSNEIPVNSVVITNGARQLSSIHNLKPNSKVQNVAIVSNISLIPTQSALSEIEVDNLQGESVVKTEPDSDGDENVNEPMSEGSTGMPAQSILPEIEMDSLHLQGENVVKKEPDSDGGENANEPMRDRSDRLHVCGNSGNSYESSDEETIDGLSADISVPSERNVYENMPLDCIPPSVLSSQLCSRDLTASSVINELDNINVNLRSEPMDPVEPAVERRVPLFQSQFHMKSEDDGLLSVDSDLISEHDEFSEHMPESIGVPSVSDMQMKVVSTEKKNDYSGAAWGCTSISESTYCPPRGLPAAFVKTQRIGRNEPALDLVQGLPAEFNSHAIPGHPSHSTPGTSEPFGRDGSNGSSSTDMLYCCQICNKTFTHNWILNVHMRIHAGDRLFRYDECDYAAVTTIRLNEHQSGRKLYKCTECEYANTRSSHMKRHQRIHSGLKPYKCTECAYTAAQLSNLRTHERIHSGVKPYKCTECEFRSAYSNHLKRHQRTHSRSKP